MRTIDKLLATIKNLRAESFEAQRELVELKTTASQLQRQLEESMHAIGGVESEKAHLQRELIALKSDTEKALRVAVEKDIDHTRYRELECKYATSWSNPDELLGRGGAAMTVPPTSTMPPQTARKRTSNGSAVQVSFLVGHVGPSVLDAIAL